MTSETNNKIPILFLGIAVILLLSLFLAWASTRPPMLEDVKDLTVTVVHSDYFLEEMEAFVLPGELEEHDPFELELETNARTFGDALAPCGVFEFLYTTDEEGEPLTVLDGADGEYAGLYDGFVWRCYRNGELLEEPLDSLKIEDGDSFYFRIEEESD